MFYIKIHEHMLLSYITLFNNLQFDVSETDIPLYQESIYAITDIEQRKTLQTIRDLKIKKEKEAIEFMYYDIPRAQLQCQQCIKTMEKLDFNVGDV